MKIGTMIDNKVFWTWVKLGRFRASSLRNRQPIAEMLSSVSVLHARLLYHVVRNTNSGDFF